MHSRQCPSRSIPRLLSAGALAVAILCAAALPTHAAIVGAVLPTSRAVVVNTAATAFATIINTGTRPATACALTLPSGAPAATFSYQTTDPNTNASIGT